MLETDIRFDHWESEIFDCGHPRSGRQSFLTSSIFAFTRADNWSNAQCVPLYMVGLLRRGPEGSIWFRTLQCLSDDEMHVDTDGRPGRRPGQTTQISIRRSGSKYIYSRWRLGAAAPGASIWSLPDSEYVGLQAASSCREPSVRHQLICKCATDHSAAAGGPQLPAWYENHQDR